jgi:DNA-binding MurR/RpiR family transcriptional regulator
VPASAANLRLPVTNCPPRRTGPDVAPSHARYDSILVTLFDRLVEDIRRQATTLSSTDRLLAAHLLEHPETWSLENSARIAVQVGVHRSTVVRFAQRLGYVGFTAFQEVLRAAYLRSISATPALIGVLASRSDQDVLTTAIGRELTNLQRTYARVDKELIRRSARVLAEARNVLVFGRRFSHSIALNMSLTLRTLRPGVRLAPEPGGSTLEAIFDLASEDAAVVVSLNRHSPSVQRILRVLAHRNIPTILLTDAGPVTPLPENVSVLQAHTSSATTLESYTALASLGHVLCVLVSSLLPDPESQWRQLEAARLEYQFE